MLSLSEVSLSEEKCGGESGFVVIKQSLLLHVSEVSLSELHCNRLSKFNISSENTEFQTEFRKILTLTLVKLTQYEKLSLDFETYLNSIIS